ncbi:hypothetical protein RR48_05879 [Papilio machaon]|uniref:Uncharacterized protein n=1 Tax=Papilio machaon TaxID=76193 RepID=A0A0N1IGM1_PAPMA|nr:hypothetical protein RR48_05879 [Papilio machaon]
MPVKKDSSIGLSWTGLAHHERRGVLESAALQALAGDSVLEKERQLSEMILQLQMVREQLLAQQEHAKNVATSLRLLTVQIEEACRYRCAANGSG